MRSKEENPIMNEGSHDIRRTSAEWIELIDESDEEVRVFLIAEVLSGVDLVKEDTEENGSVRLHMNRGHIIDYALDKYLRLVDGSVDMLLMNIRKVVRGESKKHPNEQRDLLALQLGAIDLVLRRGNLNEIQSLYLFINAFRDFVPSDLLHIEAKKIYDALEEFGDTETIRIVSQKAVSGVIEMGDTK